MGNRLAGRVALITGGSRGIGLAIAQAFAREGAAVAICGRNAGTVAAAARTIEGRVLPVACHIGKAAEIHALVDQVEHGLGPVDILVNNAATNVAQGPVLSIDEGQFDKMIEVNLKSVFRLMRRIAPGMCERRRGSVINIASVAGIKPQFEGMMYSLTKAALIMMTRSYALELGPHGVRVNAIAPGLVETVLSEYYWKDGGRRAEWIARQPVKHIARPEEIAGTAVLLASDEASYLTGEVITVDGGMLLQ